MKIKFLKSMYVNSDFAGTYGYDFARMFISLSLICSF